MEVAERAAAHAALGDELRLGIVDQLALGDRTFAELAESSRVAGNLLAHHLEVLEAAGLITRRVSEGDRRRRYVGLVWDHLPHRPLPAVPEIANLAFVCTRNSARSQFAVAVWERATGRRAASAGSHPAPTVHPRAVEVAEEFGVDLSAARPGGYERLDEVDLLITVCDRARESGLPPAGRYVHWSIPDPVLSGSVKAFRTAFGEIEERIERLARHAETSND